jgi:phage shock protein B
MYGAGDEVLIILVSCLGASMIIFSLGFSIYMFGRLFGGGKRKRKGKEDASETKLIQEIYHGMSKMEERVESLETLLLDSEHRRAEKRKLADFDKNLERE